MGTSNKDGMTKPISVNGKNGPDVVRIGFLTVPLKYIPGFGKKNPPKNGGK